MNELLQVARLGKTVGLKGGLRIYNLSDFPTQFKKGAKFLLENGEILEICSFNRENSVVVFKNYTDLDLAKVLINRTIFQTKEATKSGIKLKKGEFFYFDVLGLEICENGEVLGVVDDILEISSGYLFQVQTSESLVESGFAKIFFIPYIDKYVVKISILDRKIFTNYAKLILQES